MAEQILLVTGARVLSATKLSRSWLGDQLRFVLADFLPTLVVAGDANGADYAAHRAAAPAIPTEEWRLDGYVYEGRTRRPWFLVGEARPEPKRWPLLRNARMVESVAERGRARGTTTLVLGLTAPWSTSGGTGYTLGEAKRRGLVVEVRACPAEYGPEVRRC